MHAGENGQLNEPGCDLLTGGLVALIAMPDTDRSSALEKLERQLTDSVGAASASAVMRRISQTVLRLNSPLKTGWPLGTDKPTKPGFKGSPSDPEAGSAKGQRDAPSGAASAGGDDTATDAQPHSAGSGTAADAPPVDAEAQGQGRPSGTPAEAQQQPVLEPREAQRLVAAELRLLAERKAREAAERAAADAAAAAAGASGQRTSQEEAADVRTWAEAETHGTAVQPEEGGLPAGQAVAASVDAADAARPVAPAPVHDEL